MRFSKVPLELLRRCQCGDEKAYDKLFQSVQTDMYHLLLAILRNSEDASDALQDCFIRIYKYLPQLENTEKFGAWLHRMIINQAYTTSKARSKIVTIDPHDAERISDSQPHPTGGIDPRDASFNNELKGILKKAIFQLTERQQAAIILFEMEMLSLKETAEVMDCTEGAVKYHLHEARKSLKIIIEKMGYKNLLTGGQV